MVPLQLWLSLWVTLESEACIWRQQSKCLLVCKHKLQDLMNSLASYLFVSGLQQESEESLLARQLQMRWKEATLLYPFKQVCLVSSLLSATFLPSLGFDAFPHGFFSSWILKLVPNPVTTPTFLLWFYLSEHAWLSSELSLRSFPYLGKFLRSQPEPRSGCHGMSETQQDWYTRERSLSKNIKHWGHILWDIKWGL